MKSKVIAGFLLLAIIFVDGIIPGKGHEGPECGYKCKVHGCSSCLKSVCIFSKCLYYYVKCNCEEKLIYCCP